MSEKKGSYQIVFKKFPDDNLLKTEIFLNFYSNAQRQASFAGKNLPTIEGLTKQGVLESITIPYTGIGKYLSEQSIPKMMNGKSITIYANIKGGLVPIPVEYYDNIQRVTMSMRRDLEVCVDGIKYYDGFQIVTTAEKQELQFGSCVRMIIPNVTDYDKLVPVSMEVEIRGTLKEQITGMEFVSAMLEHGSFYIGELEFPSNFQLSEIPHNKLNRFKEILPGYKRVQEVLDSMNVKKDLDIQKCNDEDMKKLNLLVSALGDKRPVKDVSGDPGTVNKVTVSNLTLAVVYLYRPSVGYYVFDYFGNQFEVSWKPDGVNSVSISQFFSLSADDILLFDNLNLQAIIKDYKRIPPSTYNMEQGNQTMLEILKAYDKKPSDELLAAAKQMCEWLKDYPEYISQEVSMINRMQIELRKRDLSFQEKSELYSIIANTSDDSIKIGAFLLLGEQKEAAKILDILSPENRSIFENYPIFRFYKQPEN